MGWRARLYALRCAAAVLLALLASPVALAGDGAVGRLVDELNRERARHGLTPLRAEPRLMGAAQEFARTMAESDCFDHVCGANGTLAERMVRAGYPYRRVAENLAAGMPTPTGVVAAWMDSPGHRRNLLSAEVEEIGIGYVLLSEDPGQVRYRHYWTAVFGKRFGCGRDSRSESRDC